MGEFGPGGEVGNLSRPETKKHLPWTSRQVLEISRGIPFKISDGGFLVGLSPRDFGELGVGFGFLLKCLVQELNRILVSE
jgi:hypothetical protein